MSAATTVASRALRSLGGPAEAVAHEQFRRECLGVAAGA